MKAVCIDSSDSEVLQEGMTYYVFPHGQQAFYVSKFDNINSHTGAFQKDRFKVIEQEKTEETSDNYTQMNLFDFLEEDEGKGIDPKMFFAHLKTRQD